jgi:hypothetical protein
MRKIGVAVLLVTLVTSVWYFFAYLTWWEWNRALVAGVLMVAAEVGLVAILLLSRLDRLGRRIADTSRAERIKTRLEAAPTRSTTFAWLRDPNRMNVFVPVLLGAGVIASGLAWLVERIARVTSRSGTTSSLSKDLAGLAPPEGGFLGGGGDPIDLLQRPVAR